MSSARLVHTTTVKRTFPGFMDWHAANNGLKLARRNDRFEPGVQVLLVSLERCTCRKPRSWSGR